MRRRDGAIYCVYVAAQASLARLPERVAGALFDMAAMPALCFRADSAAACASLSMMPFSAFGARPRYCATG